MQLAPSRPGYPLSTADLARARIDPVELGRMIMGQPSSSAPDASQLLAYLALTQRKSNARYRPVPFNFGTFRRQLIFTENPNRNWLMLQNVGAGDLMIVFEDGPVAIQDLSAAADQGQLTGQQTRALRIVAGGFFEPFIAPTNHITIFTLNTATNGLAIEGTTF